MVYFVKFYVLLASTVDTVKSLLQRSKLASMTKHLRLNINKCKIISIHHRKYSDKEVLPLYVMDNTTLEVVDRIKDLGVYYDSLLLFDKHISEKVNKAYTMFGIIKRNFEYS